MDLPLFLVPWIFNRKKCVSKLWYLKYYINNKKTFSHLKELFLFGIIICSDHTMYNSKVSNSKKIKFTNFSVFEEDFCVRAVGLFFFKHIFSFLIVVSMSSSVKSIHFLMKKNIIFTIEVYVRIAVTYLLDV